VLKVIWGSGLVITVAGTVETTEPGLRTPVLVVIFTCQPDASALAAKATATSEPISFVMRIITSSFLRFSQRGANRAGYHIIAYFSGFVKGFRSNFG
jgi:hypothetical protein